MPFSASRTAKARKSRMPRPKINGVNGHGHANGTLVPGYAAPLNLVPEGFGETGIVKARRETIFREGTAATAVYEIADGGVIIYRALEDGRRQIFAILGPGAWIGSSAGHDYHYSAECLTSVRLIRYDRDEIDSSFTLQRQLMLHVQRMLDSLQEHAVLLGRRTAMERLAWFLLALPQLSARLGKQPRGGMVQTMLKQRDIGDFLGLKVETISRNLAILKRRMIIATGKRGQFRLLDPEALRRMAEPDARQLSGF